MSNVTAVTRYFSTANEGFSTTTSGIVLSGAVTIPLNGTSGLQDGTVFVGIIEAGLPKQQVFTGTVDTAGLQITGVKWTRGTNVDHATGVAIVDYVTGTDFNMLSTGVRKSLNDDGSLKTAAVQTALGQGSQALNGYNALPYTFNTVTYNGNRSYTCVINGQDLTGTLSPGIRVRTLRTVAAPTQSTSLNGTTQYWSKTAPAGMTFTDDFTVMSHIPAMTAYPTGSGGTIISRRTGGTTGFGLRITASGQVELYALNGAANRIITSLQSIPLNKKVHVAATADISAGAYFIYIDGISVAVTTAASAGSMTAFVQSGDLVVGSVTGGSEYFIGKLAQVAVFSAILTQSTILSYISQGLLGTETALVSAYSFNGNANDLNATNANNLSASGGAGYVADSSYGLQGNGTISSTLDYGIVQTVSFSTNTTVVIQMSEGCTIPTSGGVASVAYSSNKVPYNFPAQRSKWRIESIKLVTETVTFAAVSTWTASTHKLTIPAGEWVRGHKSSVAQGSSASGSRRFLFTVSDGTPVASDPLTVYGEEVSTFLQLDAMVEYPYSTATATVNTFYGYIVTSTGTENFQISGRTISYIFADNAWL